MTAKKLIEEKIDEKVLTGLANFVVTLWRQYKFYYVIIRTTDSFLRDFYYPSQRPPRFTSLLKARRAFDKVMIREDGMAVYGHSFEDEG